MSLSYDIEKSLVKNMRGKKNRRPNFDIGKSLAKLAEEKIFR